MSEIDDAVASARASWSRIGGAVQAPPARRYRAPRDAIGRRLARIAVADAAILVAAAVIGWFVPLGIFGALAAMLLLIVATVALAVLPGTPIPSAERLARSDLTALPGETGRWLDAQRALLPAPAMTLIDRIDARLEALAPQLADLAQGAPEAEEVRKLVGEQLPAFVRDYQRVPPPLRGVARNGRTPDVELSDGLKLFDREIAAMTQRLAADDLDSLATRGRYLEARYRSDEAGG